MPRVRKRALVKVVTFTEHDLADATDMLTIESDHLFWTSPAINAPDVYGAFVRIYPPAGITPEQVATFKAVLIQVGASAVKVMPIPVEAVPDAPDVPSGSLPHVPIRQVVIERAARTQGVRDHDALADLLTQCMDKAGI